MAIKAPLFKAHCGRTLNITAHYTFIPQINSRNKTFDDETKRGKTLNGPAFHDFDGGFG